MEHGNSLLTTKQREFVADDGIGHLSRQTRYDRRKGIRRRLRDALLDAERLLDNPQAAQISGILNAGKDDVTESDVWDLRAGLASVVGLVWLLCNQNDRTTSFETVAEDGVERAMLADGYQSTAFVTVEITDVEPVEDVTDRARAKDPADYRDMSVTELRALARTGDLTDDEFERAVEARFAAMDAADEAGGGDDQ